MCHFLIIFEDFITFDKYIILSRKLKDYFKKIDIIIDDFGDCCDIDRNLYKKLADENKLRFIEGFIESKELNFHFNFEKAELLFSEFFNSKAIKVKSIET